MISIAMATYNGEKYLCEQLDSILSQTEKNFELVICDDCSTDATLEILSSYKKKDSRIKVFENNSNLGYTKNFEKAISLCSGEYIALSDQDDIWENTHLSLLLNTVKDGNYSLVGANALLVDENNRSLESKLINNGKLPKSKKEYELQLLYKNIFQGAAILFENSIVQKALPFPENARFHDWWLALIASEQKGVFYVDVPILRYRQHGNNASGTHHKDSIVQKIKKLFLLDERDFASRRLLVLVPFSKISNKAEKVTEVIAWSESCIACKYKALSYFSKHYKEMYSKEKFGMFLIRWIKMFLNIVFGRHFVKIS